MIDGYARGGGGRSLRKEGKVRVVRAGEGGECHQLLDVDVLLSRRESRC